MVMCTCSRTRLYLHVNLRSFNVSELAKPVIKNRTFDPETRTLRKHAQTEDVEMQDTVERKIEGLAESIIAEDAERRAQDLVSARHLASLGPS